MDVTPNKEDFPVKDEEEEAEQTIKVTNPEEPKTEVVKAGRSDAPGKSSQKPKPLSIPLLDSLASFTSSQLAVCQSDCNVYSGGDIIEQGEASARRKSYNEKSTGATNPKCRASCAKKKKSS